MARTVDVASRDALFAEVLEVWREHGDAEPPLRALSDALGASPGTLLHHFGSKAELVGRMLAAFRGEQLAALARWRAEHDGARPANALVAVWDVVTGEEFRPGWRLFASCYAAGLRDPASAYGAFVRESTAAWIDALAPLSPQRGPVASRAWAGAVLALIRGAALDLLATGERTRVERGVRAALRGLAP